MHGDWDDHGEIPFTALCNAATVVEEMQRVVDYVAKTDGQEIHLSTVQKWINDLRTALGLETVKE